MDNITVTDAAGKWLAQLVVKPGQSAADAGWPVEAGQRFFKVDRQGDPSSQRFDAALGKWVDNLPAIEAQLIGAIKDEAERRKMTMATPGGMKKAEYAEKRAEVLAAKSLGATAGAILAAINLLPLATRQTRFAHAIEDAAVFGDTWTDALARFEAGMNRAASITKISAREAKVCADIRAATTAAAKRAAAAAIVWPS